MPKRKYIPGDVESEILSLSDEAALRIGVANSAIGASSDWQHSVKENQPSRDADGFLISNDPFDVEESEQKREAYQKACWKLFHSNPLVNTSVRGLVGRLVGFGFDVSSNVFEIQELIEEIQYDHRNRLYHFLPIYVTRSIIEGELFLTFTVHGDGFIEIDFIDPSAVTGDEDGVICHPSKSTMPLVYMLDDGNGNQQQIPSIYLARYPELLADIKDDPNLDMEMLNRNKPKVNRSKFNSIGGFHRFMLSWDKGLMTKRSIAHLRTVIQWLNFYENLKKYEIDHKKSSGAYVWTAVFEDMRSYKLWLSLSDADRAKTGIMAKKTPGGTLILPPGMKFSVINPQLPKISETDTDIMHMATSGLNEPEDVATGQAKGTYASIKASRGPMSDRTSDEAEYFRRFLTYDFWSSIFFLRAAVTSFPSKFKVKKAVDFKKKKAVMKTVDRLPERLLEVTFPTSEVVDYETRAKALLGTKHGSTKGQLGIPLNEIAKRMGFGNYKQLRLDSATEDEYYPELEPEEDQESAQEKKLETSKNTGADKPAPKKKVKVKRRKL